MAVKSGSLLCVLSLCVCARPLPGRPVSLELSCGVGPLSVVLEPGHPLLLDCHLGATEAPTNVTWMRGETPILDNEAVSALPNGSLLVRPDKVEGVEGEYSCVSSGPFGALASRTLSLHLARPPRVTEHPQAQVVPVGGMVRFQCQVDGLPVPRITWERDQEPLPLKDRYIALPNGILQIQEVQEDDGGIYHCMASSVAHKGLSQKATLTVTPAGPSPSPHQVVIVERPRNTTVVLGRTAVMECMAQGEPKPYVSWSRKDGKPIATDVVVLQTNLVIPDTRRHHAGVYVCRANKPKTREFVLAAAELHVLAPPVILQPPETVSLSRGNTARFVCNSTGEPSPVLRWLRNGAPVRTSGRIKTQGTGILLINQVGVEDAGYYQCVASNSLGTACATAKLSVVVREGLPSPPRLLSALPHSSTTVLLSWQRPEHNSEHIIGFSVHYQQEAGPDITEYQFAVNNDTTEFCVRELLPHTTYTFYVVAYSPMGASRPSLPVTLEMLQDVPSAPPQLSLLSISPTDIHVMWLPLSRQESRGTVTRYRIEYTTLDQADQVSSVEVAGNETQVTIRGLLPNRLYQLRGMAETRAGFGTPSEWTLHCTPEHLNHSEVIFAPTELKVRSQKHSLYVMWQPPPNRTHISGYKLYCREVSSDSRESPPTKLGMAVSQYEVTALAPDQLYEVKVLAYSEQTDGYAAVWRGRTDKVPAASGGLPGGLLPPPPPSSVQASANNSTSIWLRWERPRVSGSVGEIYYTVRYSPAGLRNASLVSYYTSSTQEILLSALKPFTRYELAVQTNGLGVGGPFSSTVEESTLPDRPSSPPAELQLTALDSSSVLASWRPPLEPNGIIVEYRIQYSEDSRQLDWQWTKLSRDGTVISTEVQGLRSATHYFFRMRACTEVGAGPFTPTKEVRTLPEMEELDVSTVTGVIVGVCLGLLCVVFCMCFSLRSNKTRKVPGGLDSTALTSQYHPGQSVALQASMDRGYQELEALMSTKEQNVAVPKEDKSEEQSLMRSGGDIGSLDLEGKKDGREELYSSSSSKQMDAEVIIHSKSSDSKEGWQEDCGEEHSWGCRRTCLRNGSSSTQPCAPDQGADFQEVAQPPPSTQSDPCLEIMKEHTRHQEGGPSREGLDRWRQQPSSTLATRNCLQNGNGHFLIKVLPRSPASSPGLVKTYPAPHSYP
ncbi:immunoglobulin superfamily DCC subclass member 4-like [Scleropages formosus]|uniref:Immunoglobulin superfamily DCC subclass member 4 n=1 Tax=Scleropages formosus TaxID=113540 RepID=A0A8C9S492_SCLFO|nr:immunoglobulin superfamily DCC subclass member 4-like [Scleropages formosus]